MSWKRNLHRDPGGFYLYRGAAGAARVFMTPPLLEQAEDALGPQIDNALRFPDVLDVAVTPDAHIGYDVGCGMALLRSEVPREQATPEKARQFSRLVMSRVGLGAGARGQSFPRE